MKIILFLTVLISSTVLGDWKIEKNIDEMTDARTYTIWTTGTVVRMDGILQYTPTLNVRILPAKFDTDKDLLYFKSEVFFSIDIEGLKRQAEVMLRLDDSPAKDETWTASTNRRGAFSPTPLKLLDSLKESNQLRIRYISTLGSIRTTRFELTGLAEEIKKVKELERKAHIE